MGIELGFGLGRALLAGLIWGYVSYKTRNRANDRLTDAATRALYDNPETYPDRGKDLEKRVRPS